MYYSVPHFGIFEKPGLALEGVHEHCPGDVRLGEDLMARDIGESAYVYPRCQARSAMGQAAIPELPLPTACGESLHGSAPSPEACFHARRLDGHRLRIR